MISAQPVPTGLPRSVLGQSSCSLLALPLLKFLTVPCAVASGEDEDLDVVIWFAAFFGTP